MSLPLKGYIEKVLSFQREKDYLSAYNILQEALICYPSNEFLLSSEVYLLLRLKRLKEARQKAEARLSTLKTSPFFLRTYIEILSKERDREQLLRIAERLKTMPVRDEKLYLYLAGILIRLGERGQAIGLLNSGLSYMPEGKELSAYLERLEGSPDKAGVSYFRERFKDIPPDRAIAEIENILILPDYKDDIPIRLFLAELYKKTGNLKKASEVYLDCLRIKDSPHTRKMLGFLYYRSGELDKAFAYLREAFLEDPEDHALYNTISKIIEKTGNTKDAEALINEALSRHPGVRKVYGLSKRLKNRMIRSGVNFSSQ